MKGIGNGRDAFTKVPGKYVSDGVALYNNNFTDVPLLWVHFDELAKVINKLKWLKIGASWTEISWKFVIATNWDAAHQIEHMHLSGYGVIDYTWESYEKALADARAKWGQVFWASYGDYAENHPLWYSRYVMPHWWGGGGDRFSDNSEVYRSQAKASAQVHSSAGSGTFHLVEKKVDLESLHPFCRRTHFMAAARETSGASRTSDAINDEDAPPPATPERTPKLIPDDPPEEGNTGWQTDWLNPLFVFTGNFTNASPSNPECSDSEADGLLATGCTCTTCKMAFEKEFDELRKCPEVKYPLGLSNGNQTGLKVKSYISEKQYSWGVVQEHSMETKIEGICSGSESGHSWSFALVKRPSAVEVLFDLKTGAPVNNHKYTIKKIDGEDSYEITFPGKDEVIYHKYSMDVVLGYHRVVLCRREEKGEKLEVSSSGLGQWPGLSTVYEGAVGGRINHVQWPLGKSYPAYNADDHVVSVSYRNNSDQQIQKNEVNCWTAGGLTYTVYLEKNAQDVLESQTQIIRDSSDDSVTVEEYEVSGGNPVGVARSVKTEYSTDKFGNQVITTTTTVGGQTAITEKTYKSFIWGKELISEKLAPKTPDEKVTAYSFYDNPAAAAYSKLKSVVNADGSWERYEYDAEGRESKIISPFGNAGVSANEGSCRVTEYLYSPVAPGDVADASDHRPRTITEKVLGTEVSRSYRVYLADRTLSIRAASSGAAYDAAGNLTTTTECYDSGDFKGRTKKITNPDGTIAVYNYALNGGILTTTADSGAGTGLTVTDGTRSVTITGSSGNAASSSFYDIASGVLLSSQTYTRDDFGRITRADYSDGTHTETVYGCCGPESETSREGTVTASGYDALKRIAFSTTAGITTLWSYDVFDNATVLTRKGSDGSECTTLNAYNSAGEQISSSDPLGNTTAYLRDYATRTNTTTNADGTQSVVKFNADGTTAEQSGSAVHGSKFEYGVEGGQLYSKSYPTAIPTQWTKSYTDFLGRTYKSVYADGSASPLFYNTKGQLVKSASPAGVVTLYQYNAKGELLKSATDLNNNGEIDDSADRVVRYGNSVLADHGTNVRRTTITVNDVLTSISDISTDGLCSWNSSFGRTSSSQMVYNGGGQKTVTVTNPDSSTITQIYQDGRLMSSTHSVLGTTTYTYDPHNRLSSQLTTVDGQPMTTSFSYDKNDRTIQVAENGSRITGFTYDAMGRRTKTTLPDGRSVNYKFALTGEEISKSGADTYPVEYGFDATGRMKNLTTYRIHPKTADTTTWAYDPQRGFMTAKTYADGSIVGYSYRTDGLPSSRTWARGVTTTYNYNSAGEPTGIDYPDSTPDATFTRDLFGRITSAIDGTGSHVFTYNPDGTVATETVPQVPNHMIEYSYDSLGRRTAMSLKNGGMAVFSAMYTYDSSSRLSTVSDGANTANYARVSGTNLLSTTNIANGANNVLTVNRTYDSFNRLTSIRLCPRHASPKLPQDTFRSEPPRWTPPHASDIFE